MGLPLRLRSSGSDDACVQGMQDDEPKVFQAERMGTASSSPPVAIPRGSSRLFVFRTTFRFTTQYPLWLARGSNTSPQIETDFSFCFETLVVSTVTVKLSQLCLG